MKITLKSNKFDPFGTYFILTVNVTDLEYLLSSHVARGA